MEDKEILYACKANTSLRVKELCLKIYNEIIDRELMKDYVFESDKIVWMLNNEYGYYIPKYQEVVVTDEEFGSYINEFYLSLGLKIFKVIVGRSSYFKTDIGLMYRILSHFIPTEEKMKELRNDFECGDIQNCDVGYSGDAIKVWEKNAYIYGIYEGEELIYIGKTVRPPMMRIGEHLAAIEEGVNERYKRLQGKDISFSILFESHGGITDIELQHIEHTFIHFFKPRMNLEGVVMDYNLDMKKALDYEGTGYLDRLNKVKQRIEKICEELDRMGI